MDDKEIKARMDLARARRLPYEAGVQDVSDLCMPWRGDITTQGSPGQDRTTRVRGVYDSTGTMDADAFGSWLKGTVYPSSEPWAKLALPEPWDRRVRARSKCDITTRRIWRAFAASNFYNVADAWTRDASVLGTGTLYCEELARRPADREGSRFGGARFCAVPWVRVWYIMGADDFPIFMVREIEIPAIDAQRRWGYAGTRGERAIEEGNTMELCKYQHVVWFNENGVRGGLRHPSDRPWVSHWCSEDASGNSLTILQTRGQDRNPYLVWRWMVIDGQEYGVGQGFIARPSLKGVNKLRELVLDAAGQDLKPPFMVEDETQVDLDIGPGGTIVVKPPTTMSPQFLQSGARYDVADKIGVEDRALIGRAFMRDLIDDPETQERSAAAVRAKAIRSAQKLAPRADKIYNESVIPAFSWLMGVMHDAGGLPELDELIDMGVHELQVIPVSPFFTAQKEIPALRLANWIEGWSARAKELNRPDILDPIKMDRAVILSGQLSDVPAECMNTDEEILELRADRQAQIDQQTRVNQLEQLATAAGRAAPAMEQRAMRA